MNARIEDGQMSLLFATPAEELAYAKTCEGGMELSPAAQALYEKEGAARFREVHGRRLIEVTSEQMAQVNAAWRVCAWQGGRLIRTAAWNRRFDSCVADIIGFKPPADYVLIERKGAAG
jgi:hypothetical protein